MLYVRFAVSILLSAAWLSGRTTTPTIRFQQPPILPFDDLVTLAAVDPPPAVLQNRLNTLLSDPFISNEAAFDAATPVDPNGAPHGPALRIAEWNINRLDKDSLLLALNDLPGYQARAKANPKISPKSLRNALDQVRILQGADIIVFDEIDDGVKRSGYHNVPREIARLLHMNYVYGVEFVELNPLYLGVRRMDAVDLPRQQRASEKFGVDPRRYLGLEGTAILSRYPILSARIVHLPQEYDWYHGEIGAISDLRKVEKWSAQELFDERLARQVRRGGRIALIVQLAVPRLGGGVLTVICPHLEDYTGPKGRRTQMDFLLQQIRGISGPLIMAGDLNSLGRNGAPVTVKHELKSSLGNYKFWLRQAFYLIEPVPGLRYTLSIVNYVKNYHDPTAYNIPILAPNHSEPLFENVRQFEFDDGSRFNVAGIKRDSFHHRGRTLSDSNQRAWKGFAPTFSFRRTYLGLFGQFKIDWMVVKQPAPNPRLATRTDDSLLPYKGRTLCQVNTAVGDRISDHCPITLDFLPQHP